jgi:hypothetical protein
MSRGFRDMGIYRLPTRELRPSLNPVIPSVAK